MRLGEYLLNDIKAADTIPYRPEYIHPFASAIDTPLEVPEKMVSAAILFFTLRVVFMHLPAGGVAH
jgi:hypothetical protein